MKPEQTNSMSEFISIGKSANYTYTNFSILEKLNGQPFPVENVLDDYIDEILSVARVITMTDKELSKYKYRPKILSYDLYGTTELDFLILRLNGMTSPKEFTKSKVKLLSPDDLGIINKIYRAEQVYIKDNRYRMNI